MGFSFQKIIKNFKSPLKSILITLRLFLLILINKSNLEILFIEFFLEKSRFKPIKAFSKSGVQKILVKYQNFQDLFICNCLTNLTCSRIFRTKGTLVLDYYATIRISTIWSVFNNNLI